MIIHMPREWQVLRQKVCIYSRQLDEKNMQWRPPYNKEKASTDPKKHFEVINFILGHFVNFLEEIYQEKFFRR